MGLTDFYALTGEWRAFLDDPRELERVRRRAEGWRATIPCRLLAKTAAPASCNLARGLFVRRRHLSVSTSLTPSSSAACLQAAPSSSAAASPRLAPSALAAAPTRASAESAFATA